MSRPRSSKIQLKFMQNWRNVHFTVWRPITNTSRAQRAAFTRRFTALKHALNLRPSRCRVLFFFYPFISIFFFFPPSWPSHSPFISTRASLHSARRPLELGRCAPFSLFLDSLETPVLQTHRRERSAPSARQSKKRRSASDGTSQRFSRLCRPRSVYINASNDVGGVILCGWYTAPDFIAACAELTKTRSAKLEN